MRLKAIPGEVAGFVGMHPAVIMGSVAAAGIGAYLYVASPAQASDTAGATNDSAALTTPLAGYAPVSGGIASSGGGGGISFGATGEVSAAPAGASVVASPDATAATPMLVGAPMASTAETGGYSADDLLAAFTSGVKTGTTTQSVALNPVTLPDKGFVTPTVSSVGPDGSATTIPGLVTGDVTTRELLDFQIIQENHNYDLAKENLSLNADALAAQTGLAYASLQSSSYLSWASIMAALFGKQSDDYATMYAADAAADASKYVAATGLAQSLASNGNAVNMGTVSVGGQTVSFNTITPAQSDSKHNRDYNNLEQLLSSSAFQGAAASIVAASSAPSPTSSIAATPLPAAPVMPYIAPPSIFTTPAAYVAPTPSPKANDYSQYMAPAPVMQFRLTEPTPPMARTAAPAPAPASSPAPAPVYTPPAPAPAPVPAYVAPAVQVAAVQQQNRQEGYSIVSPSPVVGNKGGLRKALD